MGLFLVVVSNLRKYSLQTGFRLVPSLSAHKLYPHGDRKAGAGQVSWYFCLIDKGLTETDVVEATFVVKFGVGVARRTMHATITKNSMSWGYRLLCQTACFLLNKDNEILLPNGTWIIDMGLQVQVEKQAVWYPKPITALKFLTNLLESSCCSNVTFQVGNQDF
jgi:hypothetical protein